MRCRATVGIDDDLPAREAAVAVRSADKELAGRIDMPNRVLGNPALGQRFAHERLNDGAHLVRRQIFNDMLVRNYDLGDANRFAIFVLNGHLALAVWPKLGGFTGLGLAGVRQILQNFVRVVDRGRHEFGRVGAGVSEHDALVARTLFLVRGLLGIDALSNVGRLRVQQHFNVRVGPVKAILLVADVFNGGAGQILDHLDGDAFGSARFASDDDAVGRCHRLASGADAPRIELLLGAFAVERIDDFVRDAVANLIGMPFGNRLAGKQKGLACHSGPRLG